MYRSCLLALALLTLVTASHAQPEGLVPGVAVRSVLSLEGGTIRIAVDPTTGDLYGLSASGNVYRVTGPYSDATKTLTYTAEDHGVSAPVYGLAFDTRGTLFLVGNEVDENMTTGIVARGVPEPDGSRTWSTVSRTVPYARSGTPFDHNFNGIAVSPDDAFLFVNSGSRTDHGEIQDNEGAFPGLREVPITSAILRIPADAKDLVLPNDEAALAEGGYLYADGVRNSFDLAFDAEGRLFATENSGDRDDGDEINWIREGAHYGFPWRMGLNDTPQQFPGYDPDSDPLVDPSSASYQLGDFYDDPTYPAPPDGVTFADPVFNAGPDGDKYRAPDGSIRDASERGEVIGTLTPHRSPLGLTFDTDETLPPDFRYDAFVLSWTNGAPGGSSLLSPFGDPSQDLLGAQWTAMYENVSGSFTRLARGFSGPMDAVIVDNKMYVAELGGALWELEFTTTIGTGASPDASSLRVLTYPNPSAADARVVVSTDQPGRVRVAVFDLLGRRVAAVHDGLLPAGAHPFKLDDTALPSGSYVVRVASDTEVVSQRLTVVR